MHPFWGWLVLGGIMAVMFLRIFTLAEYPMNWIDGAGGRARRMGASAPCRRATCAICFTDGAIAGVGSIVVFLPQILILFFFIGLLESTGYMARAAFIMDRLMSRVGLNGRSFIPLLSSYACAIPGIMATRTIEDAKDRLVTILVAPLMSCSARLPVYLLMIAALLPGDRVPVGAKVGLMLLMYALGTVGAFGFAWLFKKYLLKGEPPLMIMELPPYRLPRLKDVVLHMLERAGPFLRNAGTIILGIRIVLWFLTTYPKSSGEVDAADADRAQFRRPCRADARAGDQAARVRLAHRHRPDQLVRRARSLRELDGGGFRGREFRGQGHRSPLRAALRQARWPGGAPLFTPLVCLS